MKNFALVFALICAVLSLFIPPFLVIAVILCWIYLVIPTDTQSKLSESRQTEEFRIAIGRKAISVNSPEPTEFETAFFRGRILIMSELTRDEGAETLYSRYLRRRSHSFEIQIQGQFKHVPSGSLWLGAEIESAADQQVSGIARTILSRHIANSGIQQNVTSNWSGRGTAGGAAAGAAAGATFVRAPLDSILERVVVTMNGVAPPELGEDLERFPQRQRLEINEANKSCIFSFIIACDFFDFTNWRVFTSDDTYGNNEACRISSCPIHIDLYSSDDNSRKKTKLLSIEMFPEVQTRRISAIQETLPSVSSDINVRTDRNGFIFKNKWELYSVLTSSWNSTDPPGVYWNGIVDKGGMAMCSCDLGEPSPLMLQKIEDCGVVDGFHGNSKIIRCGDVVRVYCGQPELFLAVHRGWWIKLCADLPLDDSKAHFQVIVLDERGQVLFGEPLVHGRVFRLRSTRWPEHEMGIICKPKMIAGSDGMFRQLVLYEWKSATLFSNCIEWSYNASFVEPFQCCFLTLDRFHPNLSLASARAIGLFSSISASIYRLMRSRATKKTEGIGANRYLSFTLQSIVSVYDRVHRRNVELLAIRCLHRITLDEWVVLRSREEVEGCLARTRTCASCGVSVAAAAPLHSPSLLALNEHESPMFRQFRLVATELSLLATWRLCEKCAIAKPTGLLSAFQTSNIKISDTYRLQLESAFNGMILFPREWDSWLLLSPSESNSDHPLETSASLHSLNCSLSSISIFVLRLVLDNYWREEGFRITSEFIEFFSPDKARTCDSTIVYLHEIIGISDDICNRPTTSLFRRFAFLRVETLSKAHILGFSSIAQRDEVSKRIFEEISSLSMKITTPTNEFSSYTSERWPQLPRRLVLNGRNTLLDCLKADEPRRPYWDLSARLLKMIFELGNSVDGEVSWPEVASINRDAWLEFLDAVVLLKDVKLQEIDFTSSDALCFFINCYHTLLLHALIVLPHPTPQEWANWLNTVSYEIGEDVFSLSEIDLCVVHGGSLSLGGANSRQLSRFCPIAPPLSDNHYSYKLTISEKRASFLLNRGTTSFPSSIYLLTPKSLSKQLKHASHDVLTFGLSIDTKSNSICMNKMCDVYLGTSVVRFGSSANSSIQTLKRCLDFIHDDVDNDSEGYRRSRGKLKGGESTSIVADIDRILKSTDENSIRVRFTEYSCKMRTSFSLEIVN